MLLGYYFEAIQQFFFEYLRIQVDEYSYKIVYNGFFGVEEYESGVRI